MFWPIRENCLRTGGRCRDREGHLPKQLYFVAIGKVGSLLGLEFPRVSWRGQTSLLPPANFGSQFDAALDGGARRSWSPSPRRYLSRCNSADNAVFGKLCFLRDQQQNFATIVHFRGQVATH
jgi:hypothetical protein